MTTNTPLHSLSIPPIPPSHHDWAHHRLIEGGRTSFGRCYFQETRRRHILPLASLWNHALEEHGMVLLSADRLKRDEEWEPISQALKRGRRSVQRVWIGSSWLDAYRYKLFLGK